MMRSWYEAHLLPPLLDCACSLAAVTRERAALLPVAQGAVLEIGIGSGLNLPHYSVNKIERLCGLDPHAGLTRKAAQRAQQAGLDVEILQLGAERIPTADQSFDTIVCTFTLCTIPDPAPALAEMHRVLKPQGQLLFCEHGLAPDPGVARWQHRLNRVWSPLAGGCRLDRDGPAWLAKSGFRITELRQRYLPGPKPWTYISRGVARPV